MKEITIMSGKGGTGKTSTVAAFAALAPNAVFADCDVDAADLHLILSPTVQYREDFVGGKRADIDPERCLACGECVQLCRFDAIHPAPDDSHYQVDPLACEGCGVCARFCPSQAITFGPVVNGEWYLSETRHGPMVHAHLGIAEENSGKLVTHVRRQARELAVAHGCDWIITDGPPGVGCPAIAAITGTDWVVIVTEPTPSGLHDLKRLVQLLQRFQVPGVVCINKADLNPAMTTKIEHYAIAQGLKVLGHIPYSTVITAAQTAGLSVVEYEENSAVTASIRTIWQQILNLRES